MRNLFVLLISLTFIAVACKPSSRGVLQPETVETLPENIIEQYWILIELNGEPLAFEDSTKRRPFIILKKEDSRLNAHGGCNTITGTYEIDYAANRIKFSQMASTMIACLNMEIEDGLKRALEMTDNYALSADGKYLSLNRARMAPLALFEIVYLR